VTQQTGRVETSPPRLQRAQMIRAGILLAVVSVGIRLLMWRTYAPISYGDTASYMRLAGVVAEGVWGKLDGTRTPGYPAFLALVGMLPQRVVLAQMALGIAITLLLSWMMWRVTRNPWLALLAGGTYTLIPAQILFEANLLTETLTTFWIVLSFALFAALAGGQSHPRRQLVLAIALGVSSSLVGLTRPLFYLLPVCFLPFVLVAPNARWSMRLARAALFCLGPIILLGGWLNFIHAHYGMWSPTVMGGYSLVQHTGAFFELLPDDEAELRDTYLRYRDERIAERGNQTNTIWDAIPEMSRVSGLGFYDLSRELQRLSLQLIRDHPWLYARSVLEGWISFWKAPVYWDPGSVSPAWLADAGRVAVWIGRILCLAANVAFLAGSALAVLSREVRRRVGQDGLLLAAGIAIWITSIAQTLLDHGDNPRFLVPLQAMVSFVVILAVWRWSKGYALQEVRE
jgi:hypothetical protein